MSRATKRGAIETASALAHLTSRKLEPNHRFLNWPQRFIQAPR